MTRRPFFMLLWRAAAVTGAAIAFAAIVLSSCSPATSAPRAVAGYTCDDVRAKVETYGERAAELWARLRGLSAADIARIRRECRV